jgi:hypothetical protein
VYVPSAGPGPDSPDPPVLVLKLESFGLGLKRLLIDFAGLELTNKAGIELFNFLNG